MSDFKASLMYARMSGRKARLAVDLIRGLPVNRAVETLTFTPTRSARLVEKVLKSAMANASQDADIDVNRLQVSEARVDDGPLLGGRPRWRPAARGRAMPIRKRTCHIHVKVSEIAQPILTRDPAAGRTDAAEESES